jgi:CHAT domain-containing protein
VDEVKAGVGDLPGYYAYPARLHVRMGEPAASFDLVERGRARLFLDQLARGRVEVRQGASSALIQREQDLRADLASFESRLRAELSRPSNDRRGDVIAQLGDELASRQSEYSDLLARIELEDPEYASLASIEPLTLSDVQVLLNAETTLLSYFVARDFTLVHVITRDDLFAVELPVGADELWTMVGDQPWARPNGSLDGLAAIGDALVAPIRDRLRTPVVGIIGHQMLHYVPFGALRDGGPYLGDVLTLFDLPSASVLPYVQAKSRRAAADGVPLVMAPGSVSGFAPLPFTESEARFVASQLGAEPVLGQAATESALKTASGRVRVLHIASHGEYNERNPLFSRLILTPGGGDDGSLEVREVYGLDLSRTNLVVLSACETNVGRQIGGDEIVGLTRAFIYAGAPTVVSSLWTVNDRATAIFMAAFYESIGGGASKPAALQAAQQRTPREYSHPYYWAGFVLTGSPD